MVIILKTIYLVKHSGPFVDIKNYEDYESVLWKDYNRNMILSVEGEKRAERLSEIEELNNVERIFASDSVRAIASAKCLAEKNNIKIELYVDEIFAQNNPELTNIQLQHEVLHGLSRSNNGIELCFGHQYDKDKKSNYTGLNEATTQMFAEDMSGVRLDENSDYLYVIKNVMRVIKIIFGTNDIASQYFNNSNIFEERFNRVTSFKFEPFALLMNDVYMLDKKRKYNLLTQEQIKDLADKKISYLDLHQI